MSGWDVPFFRGLLFSFGGMGGIAMHTADGWHDSAYDIEALSVQYMIPERLLFLFILDGFNRCRS